MRSDFEASYKKNNSYSILDYSKYVFRYFKKVLQDYKRIDLIIKVTANKYGKNNIMYVII